MQKLPGYTEARELLEKYLSQRSKALRDLERYVEGTQYEGLPDWFSDECPLWERAPCIVYPIVKTAIDSNSDLLLGEGRFPEIRADGLEGDEADSFEKAVDKVIQQSRFKAAAREVFAAGQGCGSACAIFGVRGGRLAIETVFARWCEPQLDPEGAVVSLEVRYPYLAIVKDAGGQEKVVCKLYRRTIDAQLDITYAPATAKEDGSEPNWTVQTENQHGFGFCPVVWYAHTKGCAAYDDFDGRALHEHLTDEIRAHDFALSQRHRAALYAGDPQWTEIGVEPGFNPTGTGQRVEMPASRTGRPGDQITGGWVSETPQQQAKKGRKKSPGVVWQYPTQDASKVKVELHTLPADALVAIDNHAKDLRGKIAEALGVVFIQADSLPNESRLSGKALESFKAPQLSRIDSYRLDFGDRFMLPALGMLLRIALQAKVKIQGLDIVKAAASGPSWSWHAPAFDLVWGAYYEPSGEDEELIVRGATEGKTAGFLTAKAAVKRIAGIYGIRDIEAYMLELQAEQAEAQAREEQMLNAQAKAKAAAAPAKPAASSK